MQRTTETIDPHLHVGNRIGTKDRLLHLYTLDGKGKGLNAFGIESLIFQHQPSCFAPRVNDIILFNASSDYAFSRNCGFWHPERVERHIDGELAGQVALDRKSVVWGKRVSVRDDICGRRIIKKKR